MTSMAERWEKDPGEFRVVGAAAKGKPPAKGAKPPAVPGEQVTGPPPKQGTTPPGDASPGDGSDYDGPYPDGDTAIDILSDVALGTPPQKSRLTYTKDMLAFRAQLEREVIAMKAANPDIIIDIPDELPPLDISGEPGVGRAMQPKRNESAVLDLLRPTKYEDDDPFADRDLPAAGTRPSEGQTSPSGTGEVVSFGPGRTRLDEEEDGKQKPVDWHVDIDFPPLEQKDALQWVEAISKLATILPPNEESQRLMISMALNSLGVNQVDQVTDRIMEAVAKEAAKQPPGMMAGGMPMPGFMPRIPPGQQMLTGQQMQQPGAKPRKFGEAEYEPLTEERMEHVIEVLNEAAIAFEHVAEHGDTADPDYKRDYHPGSLKTTKQQRALGHTKSDLAMHLDVDHDAPVDDWRGKHFNDLKVLHDAAHNSG